MYCIDVGLNNFSIKSDPLEVVTAEETENQNNKFSESIKLLRQHGITMLPADDTNILSSILETGHSVVLTGNLDYVISKRIYVLNIVQVNYHYTYSIIIKSAEYSKLNAAYDSLLCKQRNITSNCNLL